MIARLVNGLRPSSLTGAEAGPPTPGLNAKGPMVRRRKSALASGAVVVGALAMATPASINAAEPIQGVAPPAVGCSLPALATFHLDPRSTTPLISGTINDRKVQFIAGLSSETAVFRPAAKTLGVNEYLPRQERNIHRPRWLPQLGDGWVRDLELDDMPRTVLSRYDVHEDFHIWVTDAGSGWASNPSAILGSQFWTLADDDFDLGSDSISLVRPTGCARSDTLPFNAGAYSQTPLLVGVRGVERRVAVRVDDVPMLAVLDSGTSTSILTAQGAMKLGRGWPLPNAERQGQLFTGGQGKMSWAAARFKTFSIGQETIQNPRIVVADIYDLAQRTQAWLKYPVPHPSAPPTPNVHTPDMILGADFFRAHHVLISNSRGMVYFVYNGAPIFQ